MREYHFKLSLEQVAEVYFYLVSHNLALGSFHPNGSAESAGQYGLCATFLTPIVCRYFATLSL